MSKSKKLTTTTIASGTPGTQEDQGQGQDLEIGDQALGDLHRVRGALGGGGRGPPRARDQDQAAMNSFQRWIM